MTSSAMRYSPRVIELFRNLPATGALPPGAGAIVAGEALALDRGAWVRFEARVDASRISACRFQAWGCPHTLAAAAVAAIRLAGREADGSRVLPAAELARELDAPAEKMGRLLVVEDAQKALIDSAARVQ